MGGGTSKEDSKLNTVSFSETFNTYYSTRYSVATLDKIDDFIEHYERYGLFGDPDSGLPAWTGKVSPSWRVPESYPNYELIRKYAKKHNLWHAHIGDPCFKYTFHGKYQVSDWVLHFKLVSPNHIQLLELGYHNPMDLPRIEE